MLSVLKFSFFLNIVLLQRLFVCDLTVANLCQVYPSEYAYYFGSVQSYESTSANCRRYTSDLNENVYIEQYINCDRKQLELTDSNLGSEQYNSSDYYVWPASTSTHQLLFIFPTRVNLTTITLHYYSDSDRGLPRLRFFVVPDDFDVWDVPVAAYIYIEVAAMSPGEEPAGPRNVSIEFNFSTKKVLLSKFSSALALAVSEVEFFICHNIDSVTTTSINDMSTATSANDMTTTSDLQEVSLYNESPTTYSHTTTKTRSEISTVETQTILLTTGLVLGTIIVLTVILIVTIAPALFFRKCAQQKIEFDSSYSTVCRGTTQNLQPQSHHNPNDLYDQIQLSPLTGQMEVISKAQTENKVSDSPHQPTSDTEQHKEAILQPTSLTLKQTEVEKSTPEKTNYAVVKRRQKGNKYKGKENTATVKKDSAQSKEYAVRNVEELYTAVQKKPKSRALEVEDVALSTPPHTVEDLYTAVVKKPKCIAAEDTPPVPPHTVEELYTVVAKKSEERQLEDTEETPPIPPHTVEELYTAVEKKAKGANEEQAPPIPPYEVEYCTY